MSSPSVSDPSPRHAPDARQVKSGVKRWHPPDRYQESPITSIKVVDCQWACPAHTPVPEYIRMICGRALRRRLYGQLALQCVSRSVGPHLRPALQAGLPPGPGGRSHRPCPAPVAICRLKRVAADNKGDVKARMFSMPAANNKNGKQRGAGSARGSPLRSPWRAIFWPLKLLPSCFMTATPLPAA